MKLTVTVALALVAVVGATAVADVDASAPTRFPTAVMKDCEEITLQFACKRRPECKWKNDKCFTADGTPAPTMPSKPTVKVTRSPTAPTRPTTRAPTKLPTAPTPRVLKCGKYATKAGCEAQVGRCLWKGNSCVQAPKTASPTQKPTTASPTRVNCYSQQTVADCCGKKYANGKGPCVTPPVVRGMQCAWNKAVKMCFEKGVPITSSPTRPTAKVPTTKSPTKPTTKSPVRPTTKVPTKKPTVKSGTTAPTAIEYEYEAAPTAKPTKKSG